MYSKTVVVVKLGAVNYHVSRVDVHSVAIARAVIALVGSVAVIMRLNLEKLNVAYGLG